MAESFSVKAILSAQDSGFSSTLKGAASSLKSLGSEIKGGLGFGVLTGIGQQAFSAITSSVSNLFGEAMETSDAMQKLQASMRFSGSSEAEIERIAGSTGTLKTYADKTVFSLQDVMSTFGALSANGIADADKMTEAVGNAVAVFGGGANEFSSVALAFSQSMAAGKMNAQDWNQILNASPQLAGGLKKELQKLNPVLAKDFKGAMEDGAITAELLGQAMNNIGMTDAAKEAATSVTTWEGAMGNLEATVSGGLMTLYDSFAKSGLISVVNGFTEKIGSAFDWLGTAIPSVIDKLTPYWEAFKEAFSGVGEALGEAFSAVKTSLSELNGEFGSADSVDGFKDAMQGLADGIKSVASFITEHSDAIAKLIKMLPAIVVGFKGLQVAKAVAPGVASLAKGLGGIASKLSGGLASKLDDVAESQAKSGSVSATSGAQMLNAAKSFALMGVAVLLIAGGFALLAFSAISLANAGGGAIAVMVGMVGALVGLGVGMAALLKSLAPMSGQLIPVATAFVIMGAAVILIAAGFALLAFTAIQLANSGGTAIAVMFGMVGVIALLAVGAALLGTALTAGAVGFIAFGAAILLAGLGAVLAAAALAIIAAVLPTIAEHGLSGASAIAALGGSMIVFAIGAAVAGAACLVLGAGLIVLAAGLIVAAVGLTLVAVGLTLVGVTALVATAGLLALSVAALAVAVGLTLVTVGLMLISATLVIIAAASLVAVAGFTLVLATSVALSAAALVLAAALVALAAGTVAADVAMVAFGAAMTVGAAGALIMAGALVAVNASMESIADNASSAEDSLANMQDAVSVVEAGLDALGDKAKSAMNALVDAFDGAEKDAKSSAKDLANGYQKELQSGLKKAPPIATKATSQVNSKLRAGRAGAYQAGAYISMGFAMGMLSQLAIIKSAAAQMAAAADAAVRAKAKIHSPSRVAAGLGSYWGEGFANGIADERSNVMKSAEDLVAIPQVATPDLSGSYSGEMSADYEYYRNAEYIITIPFDIDGREFARSTATYTQDELDRMQSREYRKHGKV